MKRIAAGVVAATGLFMIVTTSTDVLAVETVYLSCKAYAPGPGSTTGEVFIQNNNAKRIKAKYTLNGYAREGIVEARSSLTVATLGWPKSCPSNHDVVLGKWTLLD